MHKNTTSSVLRRTLAALILGSVASFAVADGGIFDQIAVKR